MLVLHPDELILPTIVRVQCPQLAVLKMRLGSTGPSSKSAVFEIFRHELFQCCLMTQYASHKSAKAKALALGCLDKDAIVEATVAAARVVDDESMVFLAKQAQAMLRSQSNKATTRWSEQEQHERTQQALEMMQDWCAERERSRKQREELLEMERGQRLECWRVRMGCKRQVCSLMHPAVEEAKAEALALGCLGKDAIVEAAAAAAKVVDDESTRSLLTTGGKPTLNEAATPGRVMAAPDKKYCNIFPSFSCISVDPARGHMQTSYADVRQSKLSKLLQNQIAQYTKMSTAFTLLSLEEASNLSDCSGAVGSTTTDGSISISSGVGTATRSRSMAVSMSSGGTAGVSGDLPLSTGNATIGDSGAVDIGTGLSAFGSGSSSIVFLVGSGTDIGRAFSVMAGNLSGAAVVDVIVAPGSSSTSGCGSLTLTLGNGNTSGGGVTIKEGDGSMASGGFITISLGVRTATSFLSVAVSTSSAGTAGVSGDLSMSTGNTAIGNSGTVDIGTGLSAGVQPSRRERARIALDLAFYHDADIILLNKLNKDEFLDTRGYDSAWWLASTAVLAFLTLKDVINSNRLFFLHAFT
jgi:hypothetical protein